MFSSRTISFWKFGGQRSIDSRWYLTQPLRPLCPLLRPKAPRIYTERLSFWLLGHQYPKEVRSKTFLAPKSRKPKLNCNLMDACLWGQARESTFSFSYLMQRWCQNRRSPLAGPPRWNQSTWCGHLIPRGRDPLPKFLRSFADKVVESRNQEFRIQFIVECWLEQSCDWRWQACSRSQPC